MQQLIHHFLRHLTCLLSVSGHLSMLCGVGDSALCGMLACVVQNLYVLYVLLQALVLLWLCQAGCIG